MSDPDKRARLEQEERKILEGQRRAIEELAKVHDTVGKMLAKYPGAREAILLEMANRTGIDIELARMIADKDPRKWDQSEIWEGFRLAKLYRN